MDAHRAHGYACEHTRQLKVLLVKSQRAALSEHAQATVKESYWKRIAHERDVWIAGLTEISDRYVAALEPNLDRAIHYALTSWVAPTVAEKVSRILRKGDQPAPDQQKSQQGDAADAEAAGYTAPSSSAIAQQLVFGLAQGLDGGGAAGYVGMASATGQEAGQMSLQHMGINKTFAFASPANTAQDLYAVRGSKVIQQLHGDHIDQLTQIIKDATDPRHPQTIQQVKATIREQWPGMRAYQVERIARTETAAVWTATSANTYAANGISSFESTIATGPSVGVESEDPCDECVDEAANIHSMDDDLPPWHPNCRCEIVPVLEDEDGTPWLPPDEPFTGGAEGPDIPVCGTDAAKAAARRYRQLLKWRSATIRKAAASCIVPMPEPGDPLGGTSYSTIDAGGVDETDVAAVESLQTEIGGWSDANAKAGALKVLDELKLVPEDEGTPQLIMGKDSAGFTVSFGGFVDTGGGVRVLGLASRSGGARKLLPEIAKRAIETEQRMYVPGDAVSPQLKQLLIDKGWTYDADVDSVFATPSQLKEFFPESVPHPTAAPTVKPLEAAPVAPAPVSVAPAHAATMPADLPATEFPLPASADDIKAAITSAGNKISGLKTRIKAEQQAIASGSATPGKLEDLNHRLSQQIAYRDNLKAHLKAGGGSAVPVPSAPAPVAAVPVVADVAPVEVPPQTLIDKYSQPSKKGGDVIPGEVRKAAGTSKLTTLIKPADDNPSRAKAAIMRDILRRMKAKGNYDSLTVKKAYGYGSGYGATADEDVISNMIANWAATSSDADARGVAMQIAAKEELGLDSNVFAASYWNDKAASDKIVQQAEDLLDGKITMDGGHARAVPAGLEKPIRQMIKDFMRAQYDASQEMFAREGIKEITVYRGLSPRGDVPWPVGVSVLDVADNPLASWSTKISVSRRSHFYGGTMLRATVPVESVLSTPLTGFGCANEYECVVLNHGTNKAWVVREGYEGSEAKAGLQAQLNDLNAQIQAKQTPDAEYHSLVAQVKDVSERLYGRGRSVHWSTEAELNALLKTELEKNAALAGRTVEAAPVKAEKLKWETTEGTHSTSDLVAVDSNGTEYGGVSFKGMESYQAKYGSETKIFSWKINGGMTVEEMTAEADKAKAEAKAWVEAQHKAATATEAAPQIGELAFDKVTSSGAYETQTDAQGVTHYIEEDGTVSHVTVGGDEVGSVVLWNGDTWLANYNGVQKEFGATATKADAEAWIKEQYAAEVKAASGGGAKAEAKAALASTLEEHTKVTEEINTILGHIKTYDEQGLDTQDFEIKLAELNEAEAEAESSYLQAKADYDETVGGKKPLTPYKQAQNKVSSTKHTLKKIQEAYQLALDNSGYAGMSSYDMNSWEAKITTAQQKHEDAKWVLDGLKKGRGLRSAGARLYRAISQG